MGLRKTGYLGKVWYALGIVKDSKSDESFERQTDAWQREAECGCGINCCERELVLTDKITNEFIATFFENGVMKFRRADGTVYVVTSVAEVL